MITEILGFTLPEGVVAISGLFHDWKWPRFSGGLITDTCDLMLFRESIKMFFSVKVCDSDEETIAAIKAACQRLEFGGESPDEDTVHI